MTDRYSSVAKAFHWTIALVVIVQIPAGVIMHSLAFSDTKFTLYQLHKSFGLIVLALSVARLAWRLSHPVPPLEPGMAGWQAALARFTHVAFYVLIIAIPLSGWLMVSASTTGIPTKIFFVIPVPHFPIPATEATEEFFENAHELLAKSTAALIVLHVGAALKHHFKDRDNTLRRMLPGRQPFPERSFAGEAADSTQERSS